MNQTTKQKTSFRLWLEFCNSPFFQTSGNDFWQSIDKFYPLFFSEQP